MLKTHKIRLDPTRSQAEDLYRFMGAARWVYNQTKDLSEAHYEATGKTLSKYDLRNKFIAEVKQKPENAWLYEVPKGVTIFACFNYYDALTRFFKKQNKFPKYHSKHKSSDSFSVENDKVKVQGKKIRLPLMGWVKMRETLRFEGKIKLVTVTHKNGHYDVALTVEASYEPYPQTGAAIGIDLNLHDIVDSDNVHHVQPRAYKANARKLARLQRQFSKTVKGSNRRNKARKKLAKQHERVANIRQDHLHKLSHKYVKDNSLIGVETLNVSGMLKNKKLAKHIADAAFATFLRYLEYKSLLHNRVFRKADRFFPSSKTCSTCGAVRTKLSLSERVFICENMDCGVSLDRDFNAALNLLHFAVGFTEKQNAHGDVLDTQTHTGQSASLLN